MSTTIALTVCMELSFGSIYFKVMFGHMIVFPTLFTVFEESKF